MMRNMRPSSSSSSSSSRVGGGIAGAISASSSARRPAASPLLHVVVVAVLLLLLSSSSPSSPLSVLAQEEEAVLQSEDYYCGTSWASAAQQCAESCATGEDDVCVAALGAGHGCYGFTGCRAKLEPAEGGGEGGDEFFDVGGTDAAGGTGGTDSYCGQSWANAMSSCSAPCPTGTECAPPSSCFAATNCDRPLERLVAELVTTLVGPDGAMGDDDMGVFGGTMFDYIRETTEKEGISLGGVVPTDQRVVGARELRLRRRRAAEQRRYHHHRREDEDDGVSGGGGRHLRYELTNATRWSWRRRRLPSGSSAIDVSVVVTGDYRPPPYLDLDVIAEDSINRNAERVIGTLRERGRGGEGGGGGYFDKVSGIEVVRAADMTMRPSGSPIGTPTLSPSVAPTADPSESPSSDPSCE